MADLDREAGKCIRTAGQSPMAAEALTTMERYCKGRSLDGSSNAACAAMVSRVSRTASVSSQIN